MWSITMLLVRTTRSCFLLLFFTDATLQATTIEKNCNITCSEKGSQNCICTDHYKDRFHKIIPCYGHGISNGKICLDYFTTTSNLILSLRKGLRTEIRQGDFFGDKGYKLVEVNLNYNLISTIEDGAFDNLLNAEKIQLRWNNLTVVNPGMFRGLRRTTFLHLANNHITRVGKRSFETLPELVKLDLSENPIEVIDDFAFSGLNNLLALVLSGCRLKYIAHEGLYGPSKVITLLLNDNFLTQIPEMSLPDLKTLDLDNNPVEFLRAYHFSCMRRLEHLSLRNTSLEEVANCAFCGIQLKRLYLNKNKRLKRVQRSAWGNSESVQGLEHLDIRSSGLQYLPEAEDLWFLPHVEVTENPFICDCKITWLANLTTPIKTQVKCHAPPSLKGRLLSTLSHSDLFCEPPSETNSTRQPVIDIDDWVHQDYVIALIFVAASIILLLIVLLIATIYHYRTIIKEVTRAKLARAHDTLRKPIRRQKTSTHSRQTRAASLPDERLHGVKTQLSDDTTEVLLETERQDAASADLSDENSPKKDQQELRPPTNGIAYAMVHEPEGNRTESAKQ